MFTRYNVSPIALTLLVIYIMSFVLYKTGRTRVTTHRKVWNVLLLVTFLITAIFGLILAVRRDYALLFSLPVNMLFWHVEAGIVMAVVSVFHLSWHFSYYRDLLRSSRAEPGRACRLERDNNAEGEERATSKGPPTPPARETAGLYSSMAGKAGAFSGKAKAFERSA